MVVRIVFVRSFRQDVRPQELTGKPMRDHEFNHLAGGQNRVRSLPSGRSPASRRSNWCATKSSTTSLVARIVFVRFRQDVRLRADGQTGARPKVRPPRWWPESCSWVATNTLEPVHANKCATTSPVVRIVFARLLDTQAPRSAVVFVPLSLRDQPEGRCGRPFLLESDGGPRFWRCSGDS